MKKTISILCALAALAMLTVPALAAGSEPARCDLPEPDGAPAAASAALAGEESTPVPVVGVPADEPAYSGEPSVPDEPPARLPGRGEIGDILSYWEENGYPADVSFAYNAGGETAEDGTVYDYWEIGLVGADEARRQEILALVAPTCLVEFKACLFTHAQKQAAYDAITQLAMDDPNILSVIFLRNGDSVWVAVPEEKTKDYAKYLIRDLGLGAVVSVTDEQSIASFEGSVEIGVLTPGTPGMGIDGAAPGGGDIITGSPVPAAPAFPMLWVCLAVLAAFGLTIPVLRRSLARLAVTTHGELLTPGAPLTRAQTEQAVKDGTQAPPAGLLRTIMERQTDESKD